MRDSTIFYRSFYEALRELPPINQGEIYNAIFEYTFNDQQIELTGLSKTIFTLIKPQLDANNKRFENGKKGGRKNQNETKPEPKANQNETKSIPNNNVNVNENENENENNNVGVNTRAPARDEFLSFCQTLDIDYELLKDTLSAKYDTFVADGWRNGFGKPITNWKNTIRNVIPHLKPMPKNKASVDTKTKINFGHGKK